jgi:hypothetical protein
LKSLLPPITKDVVMTMPNNEEEVIQKAQQYDLIYAQSWYLYSIILDAPCSQFSELSTSHAVDVVITYALHNHPCTQPP